MLPEKNSEKGIFTDFSDQQWALRNPFFKECYKLGGFFRKYTRRIIHNAILYVITEP
jgi:hypothetical protein